MILSKKSVAIEVGGVVGTIHSQGSLAAALKLRKGALDFLELRVDSFLTDPKEICQLEEAAGRFQAPMILTVRHPREGGSAAPLSFSRRRLLFRQFLPYASLVDVELRSAAALEGILDEARRQGVSVILSHHDFRATPPLARLRELARRAEETGCSIFKVACVARTPRELSVLLEFLTGHESAASSRKPRMKLSVMGMGAFGKISRLTLGAAGSVLNYGYLDRLQVSGQWPAEQLKQRLLEIKGLA